MLGIFSSLSAIALAVVATGVLSIGPQQYGEVNVLYVPGFASSEPGFTPPDPCVVDVTILNGQGNQAKFREFSLEPGQSATLTFDLDDLNGGGKQFDNRGGNPGIFTEQATVQDTCGNNANCDATLCSVNQAVEIVDSRTGVTRVLVDGPVQIAVAPTQAN
jgi:hypothetical protein